VEKVEQLLCLMNNSHNLSVKLPFWLVQNRESNQFRQIPHTNEFIEGSLEVKLPTIWTVEKQR
jgi:hypothetical protein